MKIDPQAVGAMRADLGAISHALKVLRSEPHADHARIDEVGERVQAIDLRLVSLAEPAGKEPRRPAPRKSRVSLSAPSGR